MASQTEKKSAWAQTEEVILKGWEADHIFEKTLAQKAPKGTFVFYDGPPFATGLPHYGHIVASCLKDVVPRFKTMQGYHVPRRWGWDCHGLPIENIVEKELGFSTKKEILAYGVDKFNETCRTKVLEYAEDWKHYIKRMGRFVDMENDYKTMDTGFMESVWWVFKQLWDKGLVYEGHKAMHICPRCETTLSQSEVAEGYKMIKDISATARFELVDAPGTYFLAWTTTPWTLPGNVALAVNPALSYSTISFEGSHYILATSLIEKIFAGKEYGVVAKDIDIASYLGKKYRPLFPYFADKKMPNAERLYTVVAGGFVTEADGTGIVHIAPAFGEDDYRIGQEQNLPFIQHVGMDGRFTVDVTDWPGVSVKAREDHQATDIEIIKYLAGKNTLFSKEKFEHSYPHCWRCDTPLLNYARSSWFVKVTAVKDVLKANNEATYWFPEHLKEGRSGQWIEGARDWAISRERFWASVMPVWRCAACAETVVIGSIADLKEYSGQEVTDLHSHIVDAITWPCSCGGELKRIPEVLDTWFDSGSMPYAQQHFVGKATKDFDPFKKKNFPAQYIAEGVDQTRCWFYYLNVLSSAITGGPAFENVLVNGIVLAEDGQKMSKKLSNYPDPLAIMDAYGADALRYYLMSSPVVKADTLSFSEVGVREVYNKVVNTLVNVCSFYTMYFPDPKVHAKVKLDKVEHPLDRWVLSKLELTVQSATAALERYDLSTAARDSQAFITELSQWYVRRTRDRIKDVGTADSLQAGATLFFVLTEVSKLIAPFAPFIAEKVYRDLGQWKGKAESVHLETWPEFVPQLVHESVIAQMDLARALIERALAVRAEAKIKVRQPLGTLYLSKTTLDSALYDILKDEVNVKEVVFAEELPKAATIMISADDHAAVALDVEVTTALRVEGHARELIRQINAFRKESGLTIQDRVHLTFTTSEAELLEAIAHHGKEIADATLLDSIKPGAAEHTLDINGKAIQIALSNA